MSPRKQATPTPLGNHIVRRRKAHGWTVRDLATHAGLAYTTVRNVEKGYSRKPADWVLRSLSQALENNEEVLFALAGYGAVPRPSPSQIIVELDALGDEAPDWRDVIEGVKRDMTVDEQYDALNVLRAQLTAARRRRHQ